MLGKERHLAEELARAEARDGAIALDDFRAAAEDRVDAVAEIAFAEDFLPWLEMLAAHRRRRIEAELDEIGGQEQIEGPRCGDLHAPSPTRQFQKVDRPPEEPRQDARYGDPRELRDGAARAERSHLAEPAKGEGPARAAVDSAEQVVREHIGLAGGVLRGRWRESAFRRRHQRAVADRPHTFVALHGELGRHLDAAARLRHTQLVDARVRRRGDRRDERPRRDTRPVG